MSTQIFKISLFVFSLSFYYPSWAADQCSRLKLQGLKKISGTSIEVGKSKKFWNEAGELTAHEIKLGKKTLAWVLHAHKVSNRLFVRICKEYEFQPAEKDEPNRIYGDCPHSWNYFDLQAKSPELVPLNLAEYSLISRGSFCGKYLAYYANYPQKKTDQCKSLDESRIDGIIFDLESLKLVKQRTLGCFSVYTDNEGHFPEPEWHRESVKMTAGSNKPVTINTEN